MAILLVAVLRDFDAHHHVLRGRRVVRAALRGGRGHGPPHAACPTRRAPSARPGYPWVPLAFLVGTLAGLVAIVWGEIGRPVPNYAPLWGLLLAAAGFPVYRVWRAASGSAPAPAAPA